LANLRKIFIHHLGIDAHIGIHPHEKERAQPVLIDITLEQIEKTHDDKLENTFCYDKLAHRIEEIAQTRFNLAETLAETIAADCLTHADVLSARVAVKKPEALAKADYAGVEIFRNKS
jgi:dihydroneopterin aldolase